MDLPSIWDMGHNYIVTLYKNMAPVRSIEKVFVIKLLFVFLV